MDAKIKEHIKRRIKEIRQREKEFSHLTIRYKTNTNYKKRDNQSS